MENQEFKNYLVCDSHHGVYTWQLLAKQILQAEADKLCTINPKCKGMLAVVSTTDPYGSDAHWWDVDSLSNMSWIYESDGTKFYIEENDGDLWAVEQGHTLFTEEY